jgi:hypothetical protein
MKGSSVLPSEGRYWVIAPQGFLQTFLRDNASRGDGGDLVIHAYVIGFNLSCQKRQYDKCGAIE